MTMLTITERFILKLHIRGNHNQTLAFITSLAVLKVFVPNSKFGVVARIAEDKVVIKSSLAQKNS